MTQTHESAAVFPPPPRRRRWWPSILLGLLSLLLLLAGGKVGVDRGGACCAINCQPGEIACLQRELEHAREHKQRRESARNTSIALYAASAVALGGAVLLLRRR